MEQPIKLRLKGAQKRCLMEQLARFGLSSSQIESVLSASSVQRHELGMMKVLELEHEEARQAAEQLEQAGIIRGEPEDGHANTEDIVGQVDVLRQVMTKRKPGMG